LPVVGALAMALPRSSERLLKGRLSGRPRATFSLKLTTNIWSSGLLDWTNVRAAAITSASFGRMLPLWSTTSPHPYQISVNVDFVVLNATVRDGKGRFAADLSEQDFQVYEAGARQTIRLFRHEDIPVTVGLVVDHSGSMRPKLADVIAAARTFVQSSSPDDQMFVVNFNEKVALGLPDNLPFSNRPE